MSESDKKYYESHKNECILKVKKYKLKHPEKAKEWNTKSVHNWVENNRDKWNEYQRKWRKNKKEQEMNKHYE